MSRIFQNVIEVLSPALLHLVHDREVLEAEEEEKQRNRIRSDSFRSESFRSESFRSDSFRSGSFRMDSASFLGRISFQVDSDGSDDVEDERSFLDESWIEATIEDQVLQQQKQMGKRKFINKLHLWIFGDMDVGKTFLIVKYCDRFFSDSYADLERFESKSRFLEIEGEEIELVLRKSYNFAEDWKKKISLPGPRERWHAGLVAFNVNNRKSFESAEEYLEAIKTAAPQGVFTIALVATQVDMENEREVSEEEARALAEKHEVPYYETSAKTGHGVNELFKGVATELVNLQK